MSRINSMLRLSQKYAAPARSNFIRSPLQKRFSSTQTSRSISAEDNAFNRERLAVKQHAAATSAVIIASVNAWVLWEEHWEHYSHLPPLEERVQYPYQNIRTKSFFWGDGDKTLFWNDAVNYNKKD